MLLFLLFSDSENGNDGVEFDFLQRNHCNQNINIYTNMVDDTVGQKNIIPVISDSCYRFHLRFTNSGFNQINGFIFFIWIS
jgi:hypothetical protein